MSCFGLSKECNFKIEREGDGLAMYQLVLEDFSLFSIFMALTS